ncbi:ABC transporter permease subunit [Tepidibacter mesophilus]|uniref:ABC transporter permease subunit n=1 Tax=Tepidibacter mesophilus TaxID=655607 RepID=UPI000C084895|nr:ABC transporter permease subunit [Tepidibacter mesophilus]
MKSVFNKALLYKEVKSSKWITLIMLFSIFICKTMYLIDYEGRLKRFRYMIGDSKEYLFNVAFLGNDVCSIVMVFLVIILSTILFKSERQSETYSFIASMPFKRKDIIKTKWFVGSFSIFIAFFINAILISIIFYTKYKGISTDASGYIIFQWALINILTYISIFTMILFAQTLMGQNIAASIVGSIVIYLPTGFWRMMSQILRAHINSYYDYPIRFMLIEFNPYSINNPYYRVLDSVSNSLDNYYVPEYQNYFSKIIILLILIVLFYNLAVYFYKKNKLENSGNLIMFSSLEPVFKWGFSICLGLFAGVIASSTFDGQSCKIITDSFLVIGTIMGYLISRKVLHSLSVL